MGESSLRRNLVTKKSLNLIPNWSLNKNIENKPPSARPLRSMGKKIRFMFLLHLGEIIKQFLNPWKKYLKILQIKKKNTFCPEKNRRNLLKMYFFVSLWKKNYCDKVIFKMMSFWTTQNQHFLPPLGPFKAKINLCFCWFLAEIIKK